MVAYFLFAEMEVRVGSASVPLGGSKQRGVLAALLADHGNVVSTDRIVDAVWGDDVPAKALASVRSYVANLRKVLVPGDGAPRLESRRGGYRVNLLPGDTVDLHRFGELVAGGRESLRDNHAGRAVGEFEAALALWRGDPFGEYADRHFAAPEVHRLLALRATAIEGRFEAALHLGAGADLVPSLEAAIAENPTQERLWEHLMVALYRAGRPADAVRAFDRAKLVLHSEIGGTPGRGLLDVLAQVQASSRDLLASSPPDVAVRSPSPLPFVGRARETDDLDIAVRHAVDGCGGLTLISGESGIGKTALASHCARRSRGAGVAVAWSAQPADVRVPELWTWIQILRQLGAELGDAARSAVRSAVPGVVDSLVPEWNSDRHGSGTPSAAASGFALVEGVVTALAVLSADRPLMIVLDDLQSTDDASLSALALLAVRVPRMPVRVIGNWTFRGGDRPENAEAFHRLLTTNEVATMHLRGVDQRAAYELVDAVTSSPGAHDAAEWIWRQAGGNPFYVKELARAIGGDDDVEHVVPQTVVGVVGRRLAALDAPTLRLVTAAAVIGPEFDAVDLSQVLELSNAGIHRGLQTAYDSGVIDARHDRPGGYRFSHGLVREAITARTAPMERAQLHAAVANTRAAGLATAAYEDAVAAADHAWRAGADLDGETALRIHECVIERALERSAYADIATLADQALQIHRRLPPKPEHLEREAMTWLHLAGATGILDGQGGETAIRAVQRALEIGRDVKGRSYYSAVAMRCLMLVGHGRVVEAETVAAGLRQQYEQSADPDVGVAGAFATVMVLMLRGDVDGALVAGHHMLDTFPVPETLADPLHFLHPRVACWMALCAAVGGDAGGARAHAERAMRLARSRGDVFNVLAAKLALLECAALLGELDGMADDADALAAEFAAAGGDQWGALATLLGIWARSFGAAPSDPSAAFEAFAALTADGTCAMNAFYLGLLADVEANAGRREHGRELLSRAHELADTTGEHVWDGFLRSRLAADAVA